MHQSNRKFYKRSAANKLKTQGFASAIAFGLWVLGGFFLGGDRISDATAVLFGVESEVFFRCHQLLFPYYLWIICSLTFRRMFPLSEKETQISGLEDKGDPLLLMTISFIPMFVIYLFFPMSALDWGAENILAACVVVGIGNALIAAFVGHFHAKLCGAKTKGK